MWEYIYIILLNYILEFRWNEATVLKMNHHIGLKGVFILERSTFYVQNVMDDADSINMNVTHFNPRSTLWLSDTVLTQ